MVSVKTADWVWSSGIPRGSNPRESVWLVLPDLVTEANAESYLQKAAAESK